jgi:hypothetical protein
MLRGFLVLALLAGAVSVKAEETPAESGTRVRVLRGTLSISNPKGSLRLEAGQEGRMVAQAPPEASAPHAAKPEPVPAPTGPLSIDWQPAQKLLQVDGQTVPLRAEPNGEQRGQSADGRFVARLSPSGELQVVDAARGREALGRPDGTWTHRLGDVVLELDASGQAVVRLPDGKSLRAANATSPARPRKLGVALDRSVRERLVVGQVARGSPAEKAGLQAGDEILRVQDRPVVTLEAIQDLVSHTPLNGKLRFTVRRGGKELDLEILVPATEEPGP